MHPLFLVALGGAIGSSARYLVGEAATRALGTGWPWGTMIVNVAGGLAMGLLAGWLGRVGTDGEQVRLFLGVGVLGGFTTFSTFSLDMIGMASRGAWLAAMGYALASVIAAFGAMALGLMLMRGAA